MPRRRGPCLNCSFVRDLVSHGLCARCNQARRLQKEKEGEPSWLQGPDRSQNKEQRDLNRYRVNYSKILALMADTPNSNRILSDPEYDLVRGIFIRAIDRINSMQHPQKLTVNKESKLTVDSDAPSESADEFTVNSVSEFTVNSDEEQEGTEEDVQTDRTTGVVEFQPRRDEP
jgi:hypothetical protein